MMTSDITGIGHDLVEIPRIEKIIASFGDVFLSRIFTPSERSYCLLRKKTSSASFAARFAAKEAVAKALGSGIGKNLGWHDIEIRVDEKGKPLCYLSDKAASFFGHPNILITLTHTHIYASAVALVINTASLE